MTKDEADFVGLCRQIKSEGQLDIMRAAYQSDHDHNVSLGYEVFVTWCKRRLELIDEVAKDNERG